MTLKQDSQWVHNFKVTIIAIKRYHRETNKSHFDRRQKRTVYVYTLKKPHVPCECGCSFILTRQDQVFCIPCMKIKGIL